jgi:hydrogenase expression/formation protein HypD
VVITGFEPLDILQAIWLLLKQVSEQRAVVENQYARIVPVQGNSAGLIAMQQVYEVRAQSEFRGLGNIGDAGIKIRANYAAFDAEQKFQLAKTTPAPQIEALKCAEVLRGVLKPWQCPAFANACNPQTPLGALMVSPEGSCAAYYAYGKLGKGANK